MISYISIIVVTETAEVDSSYTSYLMSESTLIPCTDPSISAASERGGLISRSDMALHNQDWTENVIGKVSEWIDLDSPEASVR
jgi:hypothetical protein